MKTFMALTGKEGIQFELNCHDKNKSLYVSLRTRNFDKKIHYCCRVSLLKKIYTREDPLRAVFKVKTLAVLFPPYPREMKTNTAKFKSAAILALACFYGNGATHSHARSIARAWLKHAHSFDRCGPCRNYLTLPSLERRKLLKQTTLPNL